MIINHHLIEKEFIKNLDIIFKVNNISFYYEKEEKTIKVKSLEEELNEFRENRIKEIKIKQQNFYINNFIFFNKEIFMEILKYLTLKEYLNLNRVCKRFNTLLKEMSINNMFIEYDKIQYISKFGNYYVFTKEEDEYLLNRIIKESSLIYLKRRTTYSNKYKYYYDESISSLYINNNNKSIYIETDRLDDLGYLPTCNFDILNINFIINDYNYLLVLKKINNEIRNESDIAGGAFLYNEITEILLYKYLESKCNYYKKYNRYYNQIENHDKSKSTKYIINIIDNCFKLNMKQKNNCLLK